MYNFQKVNVTMRCCKVTSGKVNLLFLRFQPSKGHYLTHKKRRWVTICWTLPNSPPVPPLLCHDRKRKKHIMRLSLYCSSLAQMTAPGSVQSLSGGETKKVTSGDWENGGSHPSYISPSGGAEIELQGYITHSPCSLASCPRGNGFFFGMRYVL